LYYAAYEEKNTKQKRWKIFNKKPEVFDYFQSIAPKSIPDSGDLQELDEALGAKWSIAKLTPESRKKLESHFDEKAAELEGKGSYLPDLVASL
jgi:hypothetical protein